MMKVNKYNWRIAPLESREFDNTREVLALGSLLKLAQYFTERFLPYGEKYDLSNKPHSSEQELCVDELIEPATL